MKLENPEFLRSYNGRGGIVGSSMLAWAMTLDVLNQILLLVVLYWSYSLPVRLQNQIKTIVTIATKRREILIPFT